MMRIRLTLSRQVDLREVLAGLVRGLYGARHSAHQELGVRAQHLEGQAAHVLQLPPLTVLHDISINSSLHQVGRS